MTDPGNDLLLQSAIEGVSAAFASLGRVFLCVDHGFRVVHASSLLDRLIGRGASDDARGKPLAELLGADLFGPAGTLRQLLLAGERREGWRSMLTVGLDRPRLDQPVDCLDDQEQGRAGDERGRREPHAVRSGGRGLSSASVTGAA